jgi:hypothetical protein
VELKPVLSTGDQVAAGFAMQILEAAGVEFITRNEQVQNLIGLGAFGSGHDTIAGPIEILVRAEDEVRALELIHDLV